MEVLFDVRVHARQVRVSCVSKIEQHVARAAADVENCGRATHATQRLGEPRHTPEPGEDCAEDVPTAAVVREPTPFEIGLKRRIARWYVRVVALRVITAQILGDAVDV